MVNDDFFGVVDINGRKLKTFDEKQRKQFAENQALMRSVGKTFERIQTRNVIPGIVESTRRSQIEQRILKETRERMIRDSKERAKKEMAARAKRFSGIRKPFVPGKAKKGKKLKVSGTQGARGLLSLI